MTFIKHIGKVNIQNLIINEQLIFPTYIINQGDKLLLQENYEDCPNGETFKNNFWVLSYQHIIIMVIFNYIQMIYGFRL